MDYISEFKIKANKENPSWFGFYPSIFSGNLKPFSMFITDVEKLRKDIDFALGNFEKGGKK